MPAPHTTDPPDRLPRSYYGSDQVWVEREYRGWSWSRNLETDAIDGPHRAPHVQRAPRPRHLWSLEPPPPDMPPAVIRDHWRTPEALIALGSAVAASIWSVEPGDPVWDLDAASGVVEYELGMMRAAQYMIAPIDDALTDPWPASRRVWLNPPWSRRLPFLRRAAAEAELHDRLVVAAIPAALDGRAWRECPAEWAIAPSARTEFHAPPGVQASRARTHTMLAIYAPPHLRTLDVALRSLAAARLVDPGASLILRGLP